MTEALINSLAKIKALRVISRTSAMQYKRTHKSLPEIARELNVDAVVEGSVLRSGERVRITVRLIRSTSDQHLWAEAYERDFWIFCRCRPKSHAGSPTRVSVVLTPEENESLRPSRQVSVEASRILFESPLLLE